MNYLRVVIFLIFLLKYATLKIVTVNKNMCGSKLLDDIINVPDSAFSASSSFEHKNKMDKQMDLSPKAARESYDKDNQEFAWCPKNKVSTDLSEYLEIDMGRLVIINFAQTRGRFAQGAGKEFIPFYKIHYRREATEEWRLYKKFDKTMGFVDILKGPSDPFLDAYETLDPPIVTRWIRVYPYSYVHMRVCMKLQLFGCQSENNVLEYRIPQGSEQNKPFIHLPGIMSTVIKVFQDSSYDGTSDQGLLNGGLGRLTDNKIGANFIESSSEAQHFVGWNNKDIGSTTDKTVTLWFRFDSVRNFTSVKLSGYANDTMKISHPAKLEAKFSILGEIFNDADTIVASFPNSKLDNFSSVCSPWTLYNLHHRIGQYLQLKLYFQSNWILLTEINFISEKVTQLPIEKEVSLLTTDKTIIESSSIPENSQSHVDSDTAVDAVYILTILLCLLVGIIVAISIFWLVIRHKRMKRKKDIKKHELAFYSQNPFKTLSLPLQNQAAMQHMSNSYLGKYTSGSLQLAPRSSIISQTDSLLYKHNLNSHNCINTLKQTFQGNESSIYTSIPGSDNDSSLSNDNMASSGVNSAHLYSQTIPSSGTKPDYIHHQPQIIGNPLVDFIDNKPFGRIPNNGIISYESDLLGLSNSPRHSNAQSFSVPNGYQAMEYNIATIEKSFYPNPNNYQSSPLMKNGLM